MHILRPFGGKWVALINTSEECVAGGYLDNPGDVKVGDIIQDTEENTYKVLSGKDVATVNDVIVGCPTYVVKLITFQPIPQPESTPVV
jgi:hypothetical protein